MKGKSRTPSNPRIPSCELTPNAPTAQLSLPSPAFTQTHNSHIPYMHPTSSLSPSTLHTACRYILSAEDNVVLEEELTELAKELLGNVMCFDLVTGASLCARVLHLGLTHTRICLSASAFCLCVLR